MLGCPCCGCDALVKNGSTRGVPKWKCKNCGLQTSLKGEKGEKDQGQAETVLLYLSGLSLNAKANQLWIWLAFCRDTGQLVEWQGGDRDQATLDQVLDRWKAWKVRLYCTDGYICYDQALPVGRHYQGKEETYRLEQIHSRLRHWLAQFRRRTVVVSKSVEMVNRTLVLFARFRINESLKEVISLAA